MESRRSIGRVESIASAISNAVVRIVHEHTGRGPTKSRTIIGADMISVVLRDCLTRSELQLLDAGKGDLVLDVRQAYYDSMRGELIDVIERTTGYTVEVLLSATSTTPDITILSAFMKRPGD